MKKRNDLKTNESTGKRTSEGKISNFITTLKCSQLPPALNRLKNKRLLISAVFAIVSITVAVIIKNPNALFGLFAALYFVIYTIKTTYDYETGRIAEENLFCVNVGSKLKNRISKGVNAVFMDKDSKTHTLFYPCDSRKEVFLENAEYVIYRYVDNPTTIIAFDTL